MTGVKRNMITVLRKQWKCAVLNVRIAASLYNDTALSKKKFCGPVRNACAILSSSYPAGSVVTENLAAFQISYGSNFPCDKTSSTKLF